ncbi:hypothetical protein [Pseudonocardia hydrocarbonoxydans]|uniref:hypothetical protein n=1 Tax=Pseudonocardia hydrocarbonoxydans TaxID=76726 RepID=UPI0031D1F70C
MADLDSQKLPVWVWPLGVVLAAAAVLLFDLQQWAGTPAWQAVLMAGALGGAAYVATIVLLRGARGLDRRVAIAMVTVPTVFLLFGAAGPIIQVLDLAGVKLPLRVALGAMPPILMLGAVVLGLRLYRRSS